LATEAIGRPAGPSFLRAIPVGSVIRRARTDWLVETLLA
jgi:hypothetical protein